MKGFSTPHVITFKTAGSKIKSSTRAPKSYRSGKGMKLTAPKVSKVKIKI